MGREIRIGQLAEDLGLPQHQLRRLADAGVIPFVRTEGGHRRFDPTAVRTALGLRAAGELGVASLVPDAAPKWSGSWPLEGLEEDIVWRQVLPLLSTSVSVEALRILQHATTELANNCIDHSGGTTVSVNIWLGAHVTIRITDDGTGVFTHLRQGLTLPDEFDAISALTKGRQTTMRERHSGEGIFFTSKAVDRFRLSANGLRWTVDNVRGDQSVGVSSVTRGTEAVVVVDPDTTRALVDVFREFTEDHEFTRTRPRVELSQIGTHFVSRSEAKRLMSGLDEFTDIELDFAGVDDVGQGFVDELFRVWALGHPAVRLHPMNMNSAVEFMVRRGIR